jgi:hypothetical protein
MVSSDPLPISNLAPYMAMCQTFSSTIVSSLYGRPPDKLPCISRCGGLLPSTSPIPRVGGNQEFIFLQAIMAPSGGVIYRSQILLAVIQFTASECQHFQNVGNTKQIKCQHFHLSVRRQLTERHGQCTCCAYEVGGGALFGKWALQSCQIRFFI